MKIHFGIGWLLFFAVPAGVLMWCWAFMTVAYLLGYR